MPQISRTALVPYSAEQMYQLVNDVQSYPQFLPGCTGSRILESTPGQMTAAAQGNAYVRHAQFLESRCGFRRGNSWNFLFQLLF